jgi:superfamily II DNA/RNA helicase
MHILLNEATNLTVSSSGCVLPQCIIVSPTRELAIQIYNEGRKFALGSILKIGISYGGTRLGDQMRAISVSNSIDSHITFIIKYEFYRVVATFSWSHLVD